MRDESGKDLGFTFKEIPYIFETLYSWVVFHSTGALLDSEHWIHQSRSWLDEWLFRKKIHAVLRDFGIDDNVSWKCVDTIKILTSHQKWFILKGLKKTHPYIFIDNLFHDQDIFRILKVNRYENVLWFNKESFEYVMWWLFVVAVIDVLFTEIDEAKIRKKLLQRYNVINKCLQAESEFGYIVEKLLAGLKPEP